MSDKEWIKTYDSCQRLVDEIRVDLVDAPKGVVTTGIEARRKLKRLDGLLETLQQTLDSATAELPGREKAKRKQQIQALQREKSLLEEKCLRGGSGAVSPAEGSSSSAKARASSGGASSKDQAGWDDSDVAASTMESEHLLARQREVIDEQDTSLDTLHHTVLHIKNQGQVIGDVLHNQNRMLDSLQDGVEGTAGRMADARRRVEKLAARSSSTCGICVLMLLILGLLFLLFMVLGVIKI